MEVAVKRAVMEGAEVAGKVEVVGVQVCHQALVAERTVKEMAGEGALAVVRTVMVATVAARVVEVAWLEFHQGLAVETTGEEAVMTAARVARVVLGEEVAGEMVGEAEMLACL